MSKRTPLEDVEFLARSGYRVSVLKTLNEGSLARHELHDKTGISQPTLGRVLEALQERSWVEKDGREYALTLLGSLITDEFMDLLDTVETSQQLGDIAGLLPTEHLNFDIQLLGEANIITPESGDAFSHVRRVEELVYGADHVRLLSTTMPPGSSEEHADRFAAFLESDQIVESVITANTLEQTYQDPVAVEGLKQTLAVDRARLYRYEGSIPLMAGIADDIAFIVAMNDQNHPAALIETTNDTIYEWAEKLVDEYKSKSTRLTIEEIPE